MAHLNLDLNETDDAMVVINLSKEEDETERVEKYSLSLDQLMGAIDDGVDRSTLIPLDINFSFDKNHRLIGMEIIR